VSPAGGVCACGVDGEEEAVASGVVELEFELAAGAMSSELEVESAVVVSEGIETVLVELSFAGGVEEASTNAKAGRTTSAPNIARAAIPAPILESLAL
jgi:hypothetical protein